MSGMRIMAAQGSERIEASYGCLVLVDESPLGQVPRGTLVPEKLNRPAAPKKLK